MNRNCFRVSLLVIFVAPWLVFWALFNNKAVTLSCIVPFHIETNKQPLMAMHGTLKTHFYQDLTAISFLSGYFQQKNPAGDKDDYWRINRRAVARYEINNNYLHATTYESYNGFGDNLPKSHSDNFLFPLFKSQHRDYLQLSYLPNRDVLINVAGMPPLYCHAV